jgi:hypothetical protein
MAVPVARDSEAHDELSNHAPVTVARVAGAVLPVATLLQRWCCCYSGCFQVKAPVVPRTAAQFKASSLQSREWPPGAQRLRRPNQRPGRSWARDRTSRLTDSEGR